MSTYPTTPIAVTVADAPEGFLAFHAPGCAHLNRLRNPRPGERDASDLREIQAEAAELNCTNPIAPCLRKAIR